MSIQLDYRDFSHKFIEGIPENVVFNNKLYCAYFDGIVCKVVNT